MGLAGRLQARQNQNPDLTSQASPAALLLRPTTTAPNNSGNDVASAYHHLEAAPFGPGPWNAFHVPHTGARPLPHDSPAWSQKHHAPLSVKPEPAAVPFYGRGLYATQPTFSLAPAGYQAPGWHGVNTATNACAYPQAPMSPTDAISTESLMHYLSDIVRQQGWENSFWPAQKLRKHCEQLIRRDHISALDMCAWCPKQPLGLFAVSLCDIMVLGDDSGSMRGDCKTGQQSTNERWLELYKRFERISGVGSMVNANGIDIYFLNDKTPWKNVTAASPELQSLKQWMLHHKCNRSTPVARALTSRVLQDIREARDSGDLTKPIMLYIIIDGQPDNREAVSDAIFKFSEETSSKGYPKNTVLYSFSQVGNDFGARNYLGTLNDDRRISQFVNTTLSFDLEAEKWSRNGRTMSEDDYLIKTILGACDPDIHR